jgi:hypothetical protein
VEKQKGGGRKKKLTWTTMATQLQNVDRNDVSYIKAVTIQGRTTPQKNDHMRPHTLPLSRL